jgi:hypothetical protein
VALTANFVRDIGGFYRRLPRGEGLESPYTAVVSAATQPGDRIWAAPFEPTLYLQTGRLPASTYWYLHPWLAASPDITAAVLRDLQRVQPPVVVFEADKHIPWNFPLPTPAEYAPTVYALIQQNYVPLDSQDPLLRDVYLRRDQADALRARISAQLPALH